MTVEEAADTLAVSVRVVYGMIRRKAFPAKRCGREYRINREAFLRWFTS
jgi:excisionase family DNA binding protein